MSNYPQFNFPAFMEAANILRSKGYTIISPAELDDDETRERCLASATGVDYTATNTWGDCLSRDVKLVSDGVDGIIFLPNWEKSRGARLEAFVALLCDKKHYALYWNEDIVEVSAEWVSHMIQENML